MDTLESLVEKASSCAIRKKRDASDWECLLVKMKEKGYDPEELICLIQAMEDKSVSKDEKSFLASIRLFYENRKIPKGRYLGFRRFYISQKHPMLLNDKANVFIGQWVNVQTSSSSGTIVTYVPLFGKVPLMAKCYAKGDYMYCPGIIVERPRDKQVHVRFYDFARGTYHTRKLSISSCYSITPDQALALSPSTCAKIKKHIRRFREYIKYRPGGTGYEEARKSFNNQITKK